MGNKELLQKLEYTHQWTAKAILKLKELTQNEGKYTAQAITEARNEILQSVQLTISEMEILALELESE